MPTRRGATTVTARRGPHLVGGRGAVVTGGGVSGLVQPRPLPPRNSQTKFVSDRGLLKRLDLAIISKEYNDKSWSDECHMLF